MNIFRFYNIVYSGPAFSQLVFYSRLFMYAQHHTACFTENNWSPCRSYLLLAVQVHTTSHCMFYREQLDPHVGIIYSWLFKYTQHHTACFTENSWSPCRSYLLLAVQVHRHNITLHVLQRTVGPHVGVIYSWLFKYTQHHTEVLENSWTPRTC